MPLTPFHLGPSFLIGELFEKRINLISILLASVIIDARAFFCFFFGCAGRFHGPLHTFVGATLLALFLSIIIWKSRKFLKQISNKLKIKNDYSYTSMILGSLLGTWSHIILDSFMHLDIIPFWPIKSNFLLGVISNETNYTLCTIALVLGIFIHLQRNRLITLKLSR